MKNPFEKLPLREKLIDLNVLELADFRAGHWPSTKMPPWMLNEAWVRQNANCRDAAITANWDGEETEKYLTTTRIKGGDEVDIYARKDTRPGKQGFDIVAYPKGKSFSDFWDEDGNEIEVDDED